MTQQRLAVARREADAELLGRRLVEPALAEELAGGDGFGRRQLVGVERLGGLVGLDQPLALRPARPVVADVALLAAQGHAVLVGEPLDGLGEGEPVDLHQEGDDVAALAARTEAVPEVARRRDVERRRLLVVEGAQALQRAAAGPAEGDVAGDDVVDARLLAHLRDVVLTDPPVIRRSSCLATRGVYAAAPTAPGPAVERVVQHVDGHPSGWFDPPDARQGWTDDVLGSRQRTRACPGAGRAVR